MEISTDPPPDQARLPAGPEFHPAAALFPLMDVDGAEFGELVADIREHGLVQPIVLHEGKILDGRNRHRACQHAGVEPRFEEWSGESPTAYVLSLNLHRRHLTEDQKAAVVQEARARLEAEAKERQRLAGAHGQKGGRSRRKTLVADSPQGFASTAPERPAAEDAAAQRRWRRAPTTRKRLAELAKVSEHKIRQAERVQTAAPDLAEQVVAGTMPLREAERRVEMREATSKLDEAIQCYPFLRDVPGHQPARLLEIAATLDAAEEDERAAIEDQARRWCDAQRELMPQWRAADEVTRVVDGMITRLASVNTTMSRHGAAEIATALAARIMPDNDVGIIRSALAHLSELDRELAGRVHLRRVK
jgi:ParB-like chromosome segregation protein Spo0J